MVHRANLASSATREPFTFFVAIAIIYLAITKLSILPLSRLEQRYSLATGLMHVTAIVSTVTLVNVTRVARDMVANLLLPLEALGTAAVIYFTLSFALVGIFRLLERRFLRHLQAERPAAPANPAMPLAH